MQCDSAMSLWSRSIHTESLSLTYLFYMHPNTRIDSQNKRNLLVFQCKSINRPKFSPSGVDMQSEVRVPGKNVGVAIKFCLNRLRPFLG